MAADPTRSLDQIRDASWQAMLDEPGDDWFARRLRRLAAAARDTPLRTLFPYTSLNSLQFSRCSDFPFTDDCPWIWFSPEGWFRTYPPPPGADPPPALADTGDPDTAVAAAVRALPATWRHVWVGSADTC